MGEGNMLRSKLLPVISALAIAIGEKRFLTLGTRHCDE